jgi:NADH-quinone oxidoreductase subunit N
VLLVGACVVMIADTFVKDERRALTYWIAQGTLGLCLAATLFVVPLPRRGRTAPGLLRQVLHLQRPVRRRLPVARGEARVLRRGVGYAGLLAPVAARPGLLRGEFFSLLLFSLLGMMLLASANSFLTVFLGLELMSLCLYALVALNATRRSPPRRR